MKFQKLSSLEKTSGQFMRKLTILVGALLLMNSVAIGDEWVIDTVDATVEVGVSSIAIDSQGFPHISYYDETNKCLKYAHLTNSGWSMEIVDVTEWTGYYTSIAVDFNDNPHIAYNRNDGVTADLRYAYWTGSTWSLEIVESPSEALVLFLSLALDSNYNPHISYQETSGGTGILKYAYRTGSSWSIETVDNTLGTGWYTSIALDSDDHPHISHWINPLTPNTELWYVYWDGSGWTYEAVEGVAGQYCSIALDSDDNPHISYYYPSLNDKNLGYAYRNGSSWSTQTVDCDGDVGQETSIAIDSEDNPHISYYDFTNGRVKYAFWTGSLWVIEAATSTPYVRSPSLALDSNDNAHVSCGHIDYSEEELWYGYRTTTVSADGPVWSTGCALNPPVPNPNNGSFILNFEDNGIPSTVKIMDLNGKIVFETISNGQNPVLVDAKNLENGVYFVIVENNNSREIEKLVIRK